MANLYFEDAEIGTSCTAGPHLVTKNEIIQFAGQYDPVPNLKVDDKLDFAGLFSWTTRRARTRTSFRLMP